MKTIKQSFLAALLCALTFFSCGQSQSQQRTETAETRYITLSAEQLKNYEGKFTNSLLRMDVEITSTGTYLVGQATGQAGFPLNAATETQFEYKPADVKIVFAGDKKSFVLQQRGGEFEFQKSGEVEAVNYLTLSKEQLEKFVGVYHSEDLNMDLDVTLDGNQLKGQGTGQAAFPLNATSEDTFVFKPADIEIKFDVISNKLSLKQHGRDFVLVKK